MFLLKYVLILLGIVYELLLNAACFIKTNDKRIEKNTENSFYFFYLESLSYVQRLLNLTQSHEKFKLILFDI